MSLTPSEPARMFASFVETLPGPALDDLERLLAADLDLPRPAQRRNDQLGLIIELILVGGGALPTRPEYRQAREAAKAEGVSWPSDRQLDYDYFGFERAVHAAVRYLGSRPGRVPASLAALLDRAPRGSTNKVGVIAEAIIDCHRWLVANRGLDPDDPASWPEEDEFFDWAASMRALCGPAKAQPDKAKGPAWTDERTGASGGRRRSGRRRGWPAEPKADSPTKRAQLRFPTRKAVRANFDDFPTALAFATKVEPLWREKAQEASTASPDRPAEATATEQV